MYFVFDPRVTAGRDHYYFCTCCLYVRPRPSVRTYVRNFQNLAKQNVQAKKVIATIGTVGLAEWIIDDTCLVLFVLYEMCIFFTVK